MCTSHRHTCMCSQKKQQFFLNNHENADCRKGRWSTWLWEHPRKQNLNVEGHFFTHFITCSGMLQSVDHFHLQYAVYPPLATCTAVVVAVAARSMLEPQPEASLQPVVSRTLLVRSFPSPRPSRRHPSRQRC